MRKNSVKKYIIKREIMVIDCAKIPKCDFFKKSSKKLLTNPFENAILYRRCARGNS